MKRTSAQMEPIVKAYQNRDCTQAEFCTKHKISKAVLQYWISKMNRKHMSTVDRGSFQPMHVIMQSDKQIEIETKSGILIRIPI
jgi:hypothetical protein